jgi:hypothetical protein
MTLRARRRREEAVRRLVADVQSSASPLDGSGNNHATTDMAAETHDWLVASTVAIALEKGLDRDLHAELIQETKDNAGRIGQICHDHADVFLASVAKVAALGAPSAELAEGLKHALTELQTKTAGPMLHAAMQWEDACNSYARARTLHVMVEACQQVALQLEKARKQAAAGRPRAALEAVDKARRLLDTPMETLFLQGQIDPSMWKGFVMATTVNTSTVGNNKDGGNHFKENVTNSSSTMNHHAGGGKKLMMNLEQTPFGQRATLLLPRIETEVLQSARRGLNRWFLSLRSGGDGATIGRAALRQCAYSVSVGTGQLGLGGHLPPCYVWRAKTADNLIARVNQMNKVARAVRTGYWFDRDAPKEQERLDAFTEMGMERRAEAIATAFGWYRCWDDNQALLVDPAEFQFDTEASRSNSLTGSRSGLSGSRHGLSGSRHGLRGSRHGKRSLGFRSSTNSRSQAFQDMSSTLGQSAGAVASQGSKWADLLIPPILQNKGPQR